MKKLLLLAVTALLMGSLVGCSNNPPAPTPGNPTGIDDPVTETHELKIGQAFYDAHGTKAWATATVVMEGDVIVLAYIDEYQFLSSETTIAVPNSENFVDYVAEGYVLGSKRVNNETYSANMAEAGSTVTIYDNYEFIQEYVIGKTVAELEDVDTKESEDVVDLVSGATTVDTKGYIHTVILAAKAAQGNTAVNYEGSLADLAIHQLEGAAHGTKCFTLTTVVTDGTQVVLAYIDEFQFMSSDSSTGVPNSENLTDYVGADYVLGSKRVNTAAYSANMAAAGSTIAIDANYDLIQAYVTGKTIAELQDLGSMSAEEVIDAVSSATLVDTNNYIAEIVKTAGSTK